MKIISLFFFVGMALAGVTQTYIYFKLRRVFNRLPVVAAKITHSRLLNQLGANGENLLEAIIAYEYSFRGKEYEAKTPALRGYDLFPSLEYERALVQRYPKGEFVNVRVIPDMPEVGYLEVAPLSKLSTVLSPIMAIGGILLIVAYFMGAYELLYEELVTIIDHLKYS